MNPHETDPYPLWTSTCRVIGGLTDPITLLTRLYMFRIALYAYLIVEMDVFGHPCLEINKNTIKHNTWNTARFIVSLRPSLLPGLGWERFWVVTLKGCYINFI